MQTGDRGTLFAALFAMVVLAGGTGCGAHDADVAARDDEDATVDGADGDVGCTATGCAANESCDTAVGECVADDTEPASGCSPVCESGVTVCAPNGACVPDCRVSGNRCPPTRPSCDVESGLCEAGSTAPPAGVSSRELTVVNPASGNAWWAKAFYPSDAASTHRYPAVVSVPGGSGAGSQSERIADPTMNPASQAALGFVVVIFDADGRGRTAGVEDYCGYTHQDGLKALIELIATLEVVDPAQIGISTNSYGITMASGVLARYPELPIRFLLDNEGPADRNDTGHCDASDTGHIRGKDCSDEAWWQEREAATFIKRVQVPYLRLQSAVDHAQPDNDHALLMINSATSTEYGGAGQSPWTRVNAKERNQANVTYDGSSLPSWYAEDETVSAASFWSELLGCLGSCPGQP